MNQSLTTKDKAILITIVALFVGLVAFMWPGADAKKETQNVGGTQVIASTYFGATSASFTCPSTATTTNPVLVLDNTRTNAIIFNRSGQPMFIHVNAQATTTGVVVNAGIYLSPDGLTTSTKTWTELPGAKGYVYCISPVAASGTVYSVK